VKKKSRATKIQSQSLDGFNEFLCHTLNERCAAVSMQRRPGWREATVWVRYEPINSPSADRRHGSSAENDRTAACEFD